MAANRSFRIGPVALTTTLTTNIFSPPSFVATLGTGTPTTAPGVGVQADILGTYVVLRHIRIVNKTAAAATFSLWLGATGANAAGTEVVGQNYSVGANSAFDWYGYLRVVNDQTRVDFLVGGAGTATALTFQAEGEIGVAG
jgi:hypothetical protein